MTKKDYIAIGRELREFPVNTGRTVLTPESAKILIAQRLANVFQADNPRFNRERFLNFVAGKCGPNGGKV